MHKILSVRGVAIVLSLLVAAPAAYAQDDSDAATPQSVAALMKELKAQEARLAKQEKKLADQEKALEDQRKTLTQERIQFERLQTQVISVTGKPISKTAAATPEPAAPAKAAAEETASSTSKAPEEVGTEKKETKEKPPEVAVLVDEGGVLAGKGKLVVTPGVEYDRSSATSVAVAGIAVIPALNIGTFDISSVNRDLINPFLDLRYGVTNRFEMEMKIPYVWRRDSYLERPIGSSSTSDTLTSFTGDDVGDVEFAAHYQINNGENNWPYLVGNLRFKTATGVSPYQVPVVNGIETKLPTGSGFYAIQPSLTAIFPSDPVVYYGNVAYLHNFSRSFPGYGEISGGDGPSAAFGMSMSLNDKSSFSLGYSHTMVFRTLEAGAPIPNSQVLQIGSVDLGYSYNLNDTTNLNFTVSAGVTSDAPDVRLIFRVPMTFDLF